MMNQRLQTVRTRKPLEDVSQDELRIEDVRVNFQSVDPAFLRNRNLPVDPKILADKEKAYQEEIARWADLDYEEE